MEGEALPTLSQLRAEAARNDERRNQPMTRGEILDAIDQAMRQRYAERHPLIALRKAFE